MNESLIAVIALFAIAGLPIIIIDALIIRRLRRSGATSAARGREEPKVEMRDYITPE